MEWKKKENKPSGRHLQDQLCLGVRKQAQKGGQHELLRVSCWIELGSRETGKEPLVQAIREPYLSSLCLTQCRTEAESTS